MKDKKQAHEIHRQQVLNGVNLLGVLGLSNVSLVDRPFSGLMNKGIDLLNSMATYGGQGPVKPTVIPATVPTVAQITALGPDVTANDLLVEIKFDQVIPDGIVQSKIGIVGYMITQRFKSNNVSVPYDLTIKHYKQFGAGTLLPETYANLDRNPQVEPTAGANSASEYVVLSVVPGEVFSYNTTNKAYETATEQQQGYALPLTFARSQAPSAPDASLILGVALIFKDQAAIPQTLTVTPIFATSNTLRDVEDMLIAGLTGHK